MHDHTLDYVIDRVILTPAERALLVEQAEATKAELEVFITDCKTGTAPDALRRYQHCSAHHDYIANVLNTKISLIMAADHGESRG